MSINWKELEKILSEMPLTDSYIQEITEHSYHSFTLSLFNREKKAFYAYTEIATPHTRFCLTETLRKKSPTMQRFTQYLKAHVRGKKITSVRQLPYDRAFILSLSSKEENINLLFRLYSGPGANVIALGEDNVILELLFRRPGRGEVKGNKLILEERTDEGGKSFSIRPYSTATLIETIEKEESSLDSTEKREEYGKLLIEKRNREIGNLDERIRRTEEKIKRSENYEEIRHNADLLASSVYMVKKGMKEITLSDWERGSDITLALNERLDGRENLQHLYDQYHKEKTQYSLALEELEKLKEEKIETERRYTLLLSETTPLEKLKKELNGERGKEEKLLPGRPGLYIKSGDWLLIVGRNARENDEILRSASRSNDIWMHTRDFAGGYVIIKAQKNKTVPLNILLDSAYLAIFFSKARKNNRADLYYTPVKYLKRIKGAKTGLIIPTQEKNLTVDLDEERIRRLLG